MQSWQRIWEKLMVGKCQTEPLYRLNMIINQAGSLSKSVSYRHSYGDGFEAEIKISLADLIAMTNMMALNEGISLGDLHEVAQDRLLEFIKTRLPK